ncbi:5931_t:CDS:1, partial [Acaulospora morrowiae]
ELVNDVGDVPSECLRSNETGELVTLKNPCENYPFLEISIN